MKLCKLISALLALLLVFCSCSAKPKEEQGGEVFLPITEGNDPEAPGSSGFALRIPYDYEEGVSPYTAKSRANRNICGLIYRSMVSLKADYSYELDLLSKIYTEDNLTWYLYVDEESAFPDGTEFTSYDLRYSIYEAMAEDSFFAASLDIISSVAVVNASCCKVTLKYESKYFPNLLTFPVISYKTENDPLYFPGRYSFGEDGRTLVSNYDCTVRNIELVSAEDMDLLSYEMRMGVYDCVYWQDPMSLGSSSVGGIAGLQSNRMVYLGLNSSSSFTYYADFRKAVAAAIDYEYISNYVYNHFASPPRSIFNPDFFEMQYVSKRGLDLMSANLLLDDMGLTGRDSENFRTNSRGKRISLDLLVCRDSSVKVSASEAVAQMLGEIGIEVKVEAVSYSAFMLALQNYDYDMYIAEVKLNSDMDISKLITPLQYQRSDTDYISYGTASSESLYLNWAGFMQGSVSATEFGKSFENVMPFVPLCYTKGSIIFSRDLPFSFKGTDFDMFYDILEWKKQ